MEKEIGYYWIRVLDGPSEIGYFNGKEWQTTGNALGMYELNLTEIGERIPSNQELKEAKTLLKDAASTCYGEDQETYNKIVAFLEKLGWQPE